jgi:predicted nuclease of restriction endonuclease-like (RecB) superfamily
MSGAELEKSNPDLSQDFAQVLGLITGAQTRALRAVNRELIELYWQIGEYIFKRVDQANWGQGTVRELAAWLKAQDSSLKGFSVQNLWRMKQFYEAYAVDTEGYTKLSAVLRVLTWSHNLLILGKCKAVQEREFYLHTAAQQGWTTRELERQIDGALYERTLANPSQISSVLEQKHPTAAAVFRESYLFDFLNLPAGHSEADLQSGLVAHLKDFLLELGPDFCFMGQEYRLQVGNQDFAIDLLLFHRGLQALVAFELKITEFKPAYLGQLEFYL